MVKFLRTFLPVLLLGGACFLTACNSDLLGLFGSTDLDKRLKERNNFRFLTDSERTRSFGDEYSFIVLSDTHIENGNAWGLEKLKVITDSNNEIKFAVITGDITQNGAAKDIKKFIEIARSLEVPVYPVIGNHDIYFGNWTEWKNLIGSTRYKIDGTGTTLFILDSANAFFGKDQLDWLEREIKRTQGRVFVFSHCNLSMIGFDEVQQLADTRERARIISILRSRCDAMFTGHLHKRSISQEGNVKYISLDGFIEQPAYCLVSVKKDSVSYKFEKF
jgi:predicted phosphodiesterase